MVGSGALAHVSGCGDSIKAISLSPRCVSKTDLLRCARVRRQNGDAKTRAGSPRHHAQTRTRSALRRAIASAALDR